MGNHFSRAAPVSDSGPPPRGLSSRDTSDAEDGMHSCSSWFSCGSAGTEAKRRPLPSSVDVTDPKLRNEVGASRTVTVQRSDTNQQQQQQQLSQADFQNMSIGELIQLHSSVSSTGITSFTAASGATAKNDIPTATSTIVKPRSPSGDIVFGASKLAFLRGTIFNSFMTEHELAYLAYKSELRTFSAGSVLYSQGSESSGELFIQCSGDLCVEIENEGVTTPMINAAIKDADNITPIPQASRYNAPEPAAPGQVGEQMQPENNKRSEHVNAISRLLMAAASVSTVSDPSTSPSSPPRIFRSNASSTAGTAASSAEHTNATNSPRLAPSATPTNAPPKIGHSPPQDDDSEETISSTMFHRLALQKAGWIFGFESLYKLPRPSPSARPTIPSAASFQEFYNFPLHAHSHENVSASEQQQADQVTLESFHSEDDAKHLPSIPRLANVVSTTEAMCLTISREKMERFFRRFPRLYDPFLSACGSHIENSIDNLPFLSHMSPAKLKLFASLFTSSVVPANTVVFEENDPSLDDSMFYFVHSGSVKIRLPASKVSIAAMRPKSALGKPIISPAWNSLTLSSTVAATSSTSPARTDLPSSFVSSTPSAVSPASFALPMFVGKTLDCTHYEQVLEAGSFFGELGLLLELPRIATITTISDCILFTIPRQTLRNFIQLVPDSLNRFRENIGAFCLQTTYLLQIPSVASAFYEFCAKEFSTENLDFVKACARFKAMSDAHLHGKIHSRASNSLCAALSPHQSDSRRSIVNERSVMERSVIERSVIERSVIKARDEVTPMHGTDVTDADAIVNLPKIFTTLAEKINNKYISQTAARQVNLSAKARSNIAQIIADHRVHPDMFLEAAREIHSLMNADSFIRFRKDIMFQNALCQINRAATVVHHLAKWERELQEEMNAREELEAVAVDAGILPATSAYLAKKDGIRRGRSATEVSRSSKPSSPQIQSRTVNVSYWGKDFALPAQARTADIVAFNEVRQEKQREALAEASYKRSLNRSGNNSCSSSKALSRRTSENGQQYDLNAMQADTLSPMMIHRPAESVEGGVPLTLSARSRSRGLADHGMADTNDNDALSLTAQYPLSNPVSPTRGKEIDRSPQSARRAYLKDKLKAELLEQEFAHLT